MHLFLRLSGIMNRKDIVHTLLHRVGLGLQHAIKQCIHDLSIFFLHCLREAMATLKCIEPQLDSLIEAQLHKLPWLVLFLVLTLAIDGLLN
mmetsp:Transcript_18150/g.31332  ORF Transcript_18150/g.31332 Transcript_18150/m.31332 type:complete len:91 (-) Transcript_18150:421-693(-)